ncbi:hypothetical protein [Butyrivibrio sp. AE3009]|uniref:hypothetical protein n=1 Tax=Butyrivibrio sp. AE3009 TaxID=1280666 RepID=UPI0003B35A7A|nr:hypothetical protein [Butyrivibrio sp. AE3009]
MAAVFLLANGFTNTEIGILLAIANISSALCQPLIAGIIDRGGWLTNRRFILITGTAVCAVGAVVVLFALSSRREHS